MVLFFPEQFWNAYLLMTEFEHPEVTPCGWQDIKKSNYWLIPFLHSQIDADFGPFLALYTFKYMWPQLQKSL